jgi:hypothetical protein
MNKYALMSAGTAAGVDVVQNKKYQDGGNLVQVDWDDYYGFNAPATGQGTVGFTVSDAQNRGEIITPTLDQQRIKAGTEDYLRRRAAAEQKLFGKLGPAHLPRSAEQRQAVDDAMAQQARVGFAQPTASPIDMAMLGVGQGIKGMGMEALGEFAGAINPVLGIGLSSGSIDDIFRKMDNPYESKRVLEGKWPSAKELLYMKEAQKKDVYEPFLEEFAERLATPEGQKRMRALGIPKRKAEKFKQYFPRYRSMRHIGAMYNPARIDRPFSTIELNPRIPADDATKVMRHEMEHWAQDMTGRMATEIDRGMDKLDLTDVPLYKQSVPEGDEEFGEWMSQYVNRFGTHNAEVLGDIMSDFESAKRYFKKVEGASERAPFLVEVQQHLVDSGAISHPYAVEEITEESVQKAYEAYMKDDQTKSLRLFNIIKPTKENFKIIADNLNKALVATGVAAGVDATQEE